MSAQSIGDLQVTEEKGSTIIADAGKEVEKRLPKPTITSFIGRLDARVAKKAAKWSEC